MLNLKFIIEGIVIKVEKKICFKKDLFIVASNTAMKALKTKVLYYNNKEEWKLSNTDLRRIKNKLYNRRLSNNSKFKNT